MLASPYEGLSRSNIAQQSSKGSLFTNFEDVEVTAIITVIISLPGEVQSIVMSTSVCLSVCLSLYRRTNRNDQTTPNFCACCI